MSVSEEVQRTARQVAATTLSEIRTALYQGKGPGTREQDRLYGDWIDSIIETIEGRPGGAA